MEDSNRLIIVDDDGNEIEMEILLTFEDEAKEKHFVLVKDPNAEDDAVYAYEYDEAGHLLEVTDPEDFEQCEEVLAAFQDEAFND